MDRGLLLYLYEEYLFLDQIGSTKLVLQKWHKYGTLNRVIRVSLFVIHYFSIFANLKSDVVYGMHIFGFIKPVDFRLKIFHNTFPGSGLYPRH